MPKTARKNKKLTGAAKASFLKRMAKGRENASHSHRNPTKAKSNPTRKNKAATKSNPSRRNKTRRNPETLTQLVGSPKTLAILAIAGLGSAVATRQLPQLILKANNTGWKGYASNGLAGLVATYAAAKLSGPEAAKAALTGALVIIADRIITEQYSPLGQYLALSGSGDATATGTLGSIADGYYIHPTVIDSTGQPVIPHEVSDAAIASILNKYPSIAAPPATTAAARANNARMGGIRNRFADLDADGRR